MFARNDLFVGGRWIAAGGGGIDVVSPSTERVVGRIPEPTPDEVDQAVSAARIAFDHGPWPTMSVAERADHLRRVVECFEPRMDEAIELQIDEMGGTRRFNRVNTTLLPTFLERVVHDAQFVSLEETRDGTFGPVRVLREPLGVVAAVVPWNAPIMVAATKLFPSLLMGCPMIVKTAPESPLSAYLLAEAFEKAGLPPGVVSIFSGGREVGEHLVSHTGVDKVTFTGSTDVGRRIAVICGQQIKPVTLELGGKSAAVLLPDVDLERHLPTVVRNSLGNCGQQCISANRIVVHRSQLAEATDWLVDHIESMTVGDPHEETTDFGPLAAERQRDVVEKFIASGISEGATLATGGKRPKHLPVGYYVEPTLFTDVDNTMTIAQEEIFGPVLSVIPYDTEDDAVAIANDSKYGLGGGVYSDDVEQGFAIARRIRTGTVNINEAPVAGGGGPFGGYKLSGLGRERASEGLESFLEIKSVSLPA